ncbi:oxidoreductase [Annulohypoxylon maeteangense]|uniref:oxidoreductase n=1 Tax=Annulohypoxylon maeteangense TaxID=1927788 RepID=UPI0020073A9E|nr:oxidoreductase [Annulohypoxylon maeteangense]KAI0887014.1 oxidoreductase [Annulohypoxylon maeteangense]
MDVNGISLVVGAGSGIGLETALLFAERGAKAVVFADQAFGAASEASEKSKSIATATDYQTMAIAVDVRDRASVKSMVEEVMKQFGRLDYAVNSAGTGRKTEADVTSLDESEYDLLHDINAKGILHCLQEEIAVMKNQEPAYVEGRNGRRSIGPGSIINVTSLSSSVCSPNSIAYTASKFAAKSIIKCAAIENRRSGLRINEVCPGYTDTPMLRLGMKRQPEMIDLIKKAMPLGRAATPEEIANVIHFLASPGASFVNGQSIIADSGVSASIV